MFALKRKIVASWTRLPPNLRGILWITMGTVAFAFNDVVIKTLGRKLDPLELAFFRYATGMIVLAPIFIRQGVSGLRTRRIGLHGMRLALAAVAQLGVLISVIGAHSRPGPVVRMHVMNAPGPWIFSIGTTPAVSALSATGVHHGHGAKAEPSRRGEKES